MDNKDIILLGTTRLKFKKLTIFESRGFVSLKKPAKDQTDAVNYSLPTNFYGNRVANLAKTAYPGIYLCCDNHNNVFDILVKKDEIVELDPSEIRAILEAMKIEHAKQLPKKHLLSLLGIEYDKPEDDTNAGADSNGNNGQPIA